RDEEARAKRFLYASEMVLARQAVEQGQIGNALRMLDALRPEKSTDPDPRGPEWYHLWRRCNGDRAVLRGKGGRVTALAFDSGAERLAVANEDGTVFLWALEKPDEVRLVTRHDFPVSELAFHDGVLVSASQDGVVKAWYAEARAFVSLDATPGLTAVVRRLEQRVQRRVERLME